MHRAETHDGHVLALKIQYPGVRRSIDSDVANLALLARTPGLVPAGPQVAPLLERVRGQMHHAEQDAPAQAQAVLDMMWLASSRCASAAFTTSARPSFSDASSTTVARSAGRGPCAHATTDLLFLQRKFVGSFMLCPRLQARLDIGALFGCHL